MKNKQKILLIILLIIFIFLSICVNFQLTQKIDNSVYNLIKNIRNEQLTNILIVFTNLGGILNLFFITLIIVIILFLLKKRKYAIAIALNIMISSSAYIILKNIFARPRPDKTYSLINESGYSFPSGHSTNNMAFYGLIIYLIYTNVKNKIFRNLCCCILAIVPIIIGFSRIYLGVHYFSDVIAGFCLGLICVCIFLSYIYDKIKD